MNPWKDLVEDACNRYKRGDRDISMSDLTDYKRMTEEKKTKPVSQPKEKIEPLKPKIIDGDLGDYFVNARGFNTLVNKINEIIERLNDEK